MNIKEAKKQIKNAIIAYFSKDEFGNYIIPIEKQRPIFMIGAPGIGKTAIMEQIAQELDVGLVSYSMTHHTRQSALGLPFIEKEEFDGKEYNVSEYTMSEIISSVYKITKETGHKEGILFLDEINCVSETLAPSMLQFLQYKIFGTHKVPEGWIVVTAGNPPEYNKSVREFDVVTWDRLKRIDVEPNYEVWKEYASKKGVHGSVLTFLEIKNDMFYRIETTINGKAFVTARGWEDLSEMIKLYEKNNIKVDITLISQYLQHKETAKEFSIYYDLYNKYKSDYQIHDILNGTCEESIKERAKKARFDERLSLVGMLIDAIDSELKDCIFKDNGIVSNLTNLKDIKKQLLEKQEEYKSTIDKKIAIIETTLINGLKANSLDSENEYAYRYCIDFLRKRTYDLQKSGITNSEEAFKNIKKVYDFNLNEHKTNIETLKIKLHNLFEFIEEVFNDGQEMLILVTELTVRYYTAKFISKFGCDDYFKHNNNILFYDKKKDILKSIEEMGL